MDKLIQEWIKCKNKVSEAENAQKEAYLKAEACKLPVNLRKADSKDIVKGNIIWYPKWDDGMSRLWNMVDYVIDPSCEYKGYYSQSGCRHGLNGAFVEKEK